MNYNVSIVNNYLFLGGFSMNMETTTVERFRGSYLVTNIEGLCIKVSQRQVDAIANESEEHNKNEIAILLATIKAARILNSSKAIQYRKIDEDDKIRSLVKLLRYYDIENLNSIFEELKYYEIKDVLESNCPIKTLSDML